MLEGQTVLYGKVVGYERRKGLRRLQVELESGSIFLPRGRGNFNILAYENHAYIKARNWGEYYIAIDYVCNLIKNYCVANRTDEFGL